MLKTLLDRIESIDSRVREEELKIELFATLIPFLLSVEIFKRNIDIMEFVKMLHLKKPILPYVYANRTLLVAKIARELESFNKEQLNYNTKVLKEYSRRDITPNKTKSNNKSISKEKLIIDMLDKYSRNK